MSYGCGSVMLPILGRVINTAMIFEATYLTYDLFLTPTYKKISKSLQTMNGDAATS
ncbi:conserved Plasmodium protein, unknown function [Babesia microti strain RI]|uniref:Uncharacterized protein n=1 Tax=Babesia microti (strain RI) TaxID=1133968 RepID=A0A1R4AAI4_BABMR|nr:conserved Plasmodium protein, unknown function [Babesia microti strain RI]SJK86016.1 conserved Plasmodium protein, unknown function [Babesia microti strain RI]|eukprot:XP_021338215.1 conserved Plasmodium protein, unknown function [Babesia microti strain RI]